MGVRCVATRGRCGSEWLHVLPAVTAPYITKSPVLYKLTPVLINTCASSLNITRQRLRHSIQVIPSRSCVLFLPSCLPPFLESTDRFVFLSFNQSLIWFPFTFLKPYLYFFSVIFRQYCFRLFALFTLNFVCRMFVATSLLLAIATLVVKASPHNYLIMDIEPPKSVSERDILNLLSPLQVKHSFRVS